MDDYDWDCLDTFEGCCLGSDVDYEEDSDED